jgi:hypothetical protein
MMRDSGWWHPFVVGIPMLGCMIVSWVADNIQAGDPMFFVRLGGIAIVLFLAWLVMTIMDDRKAKRYQKPQATVISNNVIRVTGNVESLQRMGVPGAYEWVHRGFKVWDVHIRSNSIGDWEVQSAADLINGWDGTTQ